MEVQSAGGEMTAPRQPSLSGGDDINRIPARPGRPSFSGGGDDNRNYEIMTPIPARPGRPYEIMTPVPARRAHRCNSYYGVNLSEMLFSELLSAIRARAQCRDSRGISTICDKYWSIIAASRTVANGFTSERNPKITIDSQELFRKLENRNNTLSYRDLFGDVNTNGRVLDEGEVFARRSGEFDTQIRNDARMAGTGIAMEDVEKFERDKLKKLFEFLHSFLYRDFTSEQQSISLSMVDLSALITDILCKGSLNEDGQPIEIPRLFREQLLHTVTSWLLLPVIERYQYNALIWMRTYIMASYPARMQQRTSEADAKVANAMKSRWLRLHSEHQQRRTDMVSRNKALANLMNTAHGICRKGAESLLNLVIYTCNVML